MRFLYLIPFSYFYITRLRHASLAFHLVFEWMAALVLVSVFYNHGWFAAICASLLSYFAFISIYEIGYLANDLFSAKREADGRARGPQDAGWRWIACWIAVRIIAFLTMAAALDRLSSGGWWSFFTALSLVLVSHNTLVDRELKAISFIWLSWFRFMAPIIFVVDASQVASIGLCAAMSYCSFRLLGYLDSKGLLKMQGRQTSKFRLSFFLAPLCGALALWTYQGTDGFMVLSGYYFFAATIGGLSRSLKQRS